MSQIDEITTWLADHWQRFALGYTRRMDLQDLVIRYVGAGRGLWLSDRPLEERAQMLRELTEHVHTIYFVRRWRVIKVVSQEITQLRARLDVLEGNSSPTAARNQGPVASGFQERT